MLAHVDVRNVHQALPEGSYQLRLNGVRRDSRNGPVISYPGLFVTTYEQPTERVLFHPQRDANPFLHLLESMWMLAGRNDVEFVASLSRQMLEYSDDGKTLNGAYGYRWRHHFGHDQLFSIAKALERNQDCRRQVLSMWDGRQDLNMGPTRDVPCNTQAYFQVDFQGRLCLTVCNRSNDMVWGAYGANAVHFSFLLEFVAAAAKLPVGTYQQVSANTHVYEKHFELVEQMEAMAFMDRHEQHGRTCPYSLGEVEAARTFETWDIAAWLCECYQLLHGMLDHLRDPFMVEVAAPMYLAHQEFRKKENPDRIDAALAHLGDMPERNDWRRAATEWLERRRK